MNKFLLTDIDGCVLDWHKGFINFVQQLGFVLNTKNHFKSYDMDTWFKNMSNKQFRGMVKLFNNSQFSNLCPPYRDALDYLPKIAKSNRVEALTAFGNRPEQKEMRKQILESLFPDVFDEIHVIDLGECKKSYLKRLKPDVFVEDSLSHADSAIELGIDTYVIPTSYNRGGHYKYLPDANPWEHLHKFAFNKG